MTATGDEGCTGEDFTDAVFAEQEWEGRSFVDCRFTDADLRGLRTRSCRFTRSPARIAAADNPHRLRSEASFAALCGVSLLEASGPRSQPLPQALHRPRDLPDHHGPTQS